MPRQHLLRCALWHNLQHLRPRPSPAMSGLFFVLLGGLSRNRTAVAPMRKGADCWRHTRHGVSFRDLELFQHFIAENAGLVVRTTMRNRAAVLFCPTPKTIAVSINPEPHLCTPPNVTQTWH